MLEAKFGDDSLKTAGPKKHEHLSVFTLLPKKISGFNICALISTFT